MGLLHHFVAEVCNTGQSSFFALTDSVNQGFSKIDHSGIDARIVLEQNEFSKTQEVSTTVLGSKAQYLLEVNFLLNLFYSNLFTSTNK